jgi:pyrroline-5-carboxylate reductase
MLSDSPTPQLALFGFGNLGSAIVEGAIRRRVLHPREVVVVEPDPAARSAAERLGLRAGRDPSDAAACGRLLVAVKPQCWPAVASAIEALPPHSDGDATRLLVSVMAGIASSRIEQECGGRVRVVRAMPNTPARIGLGITAVAATLATPQERAFVRRLFDAVGEIVEVPESQFHAVTAVSGSGPAYVFRLAECMEQAAKRLGLSAAVSRALVSRTIRGAGSMLVEDGADPASLRDAVTSRGGTTAAALEQFERWGMEPAVVDAIAAAEARSRELSGDQPIAPESKPPAASS